MVKILVKKRIATGKIAEKLEKIAACSQGVCIPIAVPNGDFAFDTTEDIKTYWDSLTESKQKSIIKKYVEGNSGLEDIIEEEMNKH
ncbi:MAG: hypothetical protein WA130_01310 [Candidatus Methanoperedens sp.]